MLVDDMRLLPSSHIYQQRPTHRFNLNRMTSAPLYRLNHAFETQPRNHHGWRLSAWSQARDAQPLSLPQMLIEDQKEL
jgi:hypothetical protein